MSAQVWPPISHENLLIKEEESLAAELLWLLSTLQSALPSLKSGLEECVSLLSPTQPSTLALSTPRSESIKGHITRSGTRITKGEIALRLPTLPPLRGSAAFPLKIATPISLPQLSQLLTLLNQALDIIDISSWTGDPRNGQFIAGQLKLLHDTLEEARTTLKGGDEVPGCQWWDTHPSPHTDAPPASSSADVVDSPFGAIPPTLSPHLSISDAALVLTVRTLGPPQPSTTDALSLTGLSIRTRLGLAQRPQVHDEIDQVFAWKGEEVGVREKVRVESMDPSLMAVMAKLSALGHSVKGWRVKVGIVMGEDVEV